MTLLTTLSITPELAQRLERVEALNTAGYAQALKQLQPHSAAVVQAVGDGLAVFTRPDFPMNRTVGLGMAGGVQPFDATDAVEQAEAFYQARGVPSQVLICPFTVLDVRRGLGRRGYYADYFFNVHARPITPEDADWAAPAGIRISVVEPAQFDLWAQTNIGTHRDMAEVPPDDVWLTLCQVTVRRSQVLGFIAWVDGEPAGSAALSVHEGVATLFSAGTRPPFRRRGVQKALLHARLAEAQRQGCDLAHVTTSPGSDSQRNVGRAGFVLAYQRINMRRDGSA